MLGVHVSEPILEWEERGKNICLLEAFKRGSDLNFIQTGNERVTEIKRPFSPT